MQGLEELIAAAPVFAGLAPDQLELVAGCGANRRAEAGEVLFREGDPADLFFLIRAGTIALEVHSPGRGALVIDTLHDGDLVGWSWLFPPYRWRVDGRAVGPAALIAFDGLCLRGKCEADHELGYQLMRRFAAGAIERLQATRFQLLDVYANPAAR
ncbi:MAG TPA: cyclic nucleotide-binding domain-containing protein [Solirubrobacterales bacterium]|nr:cyclic nucleotide-binding domain-containing protein [Solirubrobacterales bacterium]